jgi:hypothetical protein
MGSVYMLSRGKVVELLIPGGALAAPVSRTIPSVALHVELGFIDSIYHDLGNAQRQQYHLRLYQSYPAGTVRTRSIYRNSCEKSMTISNLYKSAQERAPGTPALTPQHFQIINIHVVTVQLSESRSGATVLFPVIDVLQLFIWWNQ